MIRKETWAVLAVFALVLLGAYLWTRSEAAKPPEPTPTAAGSGGEMVFNLTGKVTKVRIEKTGGGSLELTAGDNGNYSITEPQGLETDPTVADQAVAQLTSLTTVSRLMEVPQASAMGLEPPAYRLVVTTEDGKQTVVNVGNVTPTQSGYYVLSADRNVYIVSKYALESLLGLIEAPPVMPTPTTAVTPYPDVTATP